MSIQNLDTFLAKTQFPEPALAPVKERAASYVEMVTKSNLLVTQIQAAKDSDPNNPEFLDKLWAQHVSESPEMAEVEANYQALIEESEKLLVQLREFAKGHIPERLDAEAEKAARKTVNDMSPTITQARNGLAEMLSMPEAMLKAHGVEFPKDGLISLLPTPESLKGGGKGRKAAGESSVSYMTRVNDVLIDGKSTQMNGKGKFAYAAEKLTVRFNGKTLAQNKVTPEELEEAYFASLPNSPEVRSIKSTALPNEHTFTFTKEIDVQNGNDDSFKKEPQSVSLTVRGVNYGEAAKAETPNTETEKAETEKVAEPKAETLKPGDHIRPEPAKAETVKANDTAPAKKAAAPKK